MKTIKDKMVDIMCQYYQNKIKDNNELISLYKDIISRDDIVDSLNIAILERDKSAIEDILHIAFTLNIFCNRTEIVIRTLLLEDWHYRHEDIIGLFQRNFNNNETNIPVLLKAIETIPEYLKEEDFKYPYIRKIIYAIGAQPEPYNVEALETLTKLEDEEIKKLALHQIEKRKRLGRWEANKNEE